MTRTELEQYIQDHYSTEPDYPWGKYPHFWVFRHRSNGKWFALIMDVPREKLGLSGGETLDVVNFKCDSLLIGSLLGQPGVFPAYHMSKESWLTLALDGSVPDDTLRMLLDVSYEATKPKMRKIRKK